ncbi:TPA: amidohydrolase family protein [Mannheimia haemolytica]
MIILKNVDYYDIKNKLIISNKFLVIDEGKISTIGCMEEYDNFKVSLPLLISEMDCRKFILFPGLINSHLHPSKEIYNGLNDFDNIKDILNKVHQNNKLETEETQTISTLYSILNQIKSGITSIGIFTSRPTSDINAVTFSKIRANIHYCQSNQWIGDGEKPKISEVDKLLDNYYYVQNNLSSDLIYISPATASELSADSILLSELHKIAKTHNKKLFLHVHEGKTQVESFRQYYNSTAIDYLNRLNILDRNISLIHCSYLTQQDISILNDTDSNLIHCPVSNSYVGASTMPISLLKSKNIGLGTDAAMVNPLNNLLFEAFFCLYHHGPSNLAEKVNSEYILDMITRLGANVLDIPAIGKIKGGNFADLIFLEKDKVSLRNSISTLTHLYNTPPIHVMINGEFIIKDKVFTTISYDDIENGFRQITNNLKGN